MSETNPTAFATARKEAAKLLDSKPKVITPPTIPQVAVVEAPPVKKKKKKRRSRRKERGLYAEVEYPRGMGKLRCEVCLLPYRDHDSFPCNKSVGIVDR